MMNKCSIGDTGIVERIIKFIDYKGITINKFETSSGLARGYLARLKGSVGSDKLNNICITFPELSIEWLITGKGEMLKCNIVGRDNVGTGNEITGDNTGIIGNTGTVGNVGGNHVSIPTNNIKKIMNEDGVGIEFTQSIDSLQQINAHLEARVKNLEMLNDSQANYNKMLMDTNQKLADTNQKLVERILELTEKGIAEGARDVVSKAAHG